MDPADRHEYYLLDEVPPQARPVPDIGPSPKEILIASGLFVATCFSTWLTGGVFYSAAIMSILICHEFGHYLMCRRYRVPSTLPLFLPLPYLSPFGTLGAVIRMKAQIRDRRTLFDIGIAGPLAGIPLAVVASVWGLQQSALIDPGELEVSFELGGSLLFSGLEKLFFAERPEGMDVLLHPLAYAGWAGLFVTALNLIPVGQLDGGHVAYGLFGRRAVYVSYLLAVAMGVAGFWFPGWWVFLALLLVLKLRHPRTPDEHLPIGRLRLGLGVFALVFFILSFVPIPIHVP